ncbi:MAG: efflux RND transporter periplasmic adaptor subunit [Bacteroidetes bacterium]|uniref:Efflux RND transporter periplasmic adaptor subunit n=1 Tax=Candidatus Pullibacteroides excrementavium TaxID=2840905 RepID=A0A9D9H2C4_9BACT|nr:efflux RND transporter periplasmic adaptor subunit [Candidatus Pullibacteroides excrementavium]
MKKTIFILCAAACLGLVSCKQQQQTGQAPAPRNVLQLKTEECVLTKPYSSILLANGSVEVRPRVSGYIFKQHVNEGDYVKAGDLLFTIDTVQVVAEINVARANIEAAKAQVETAQLTFDTKNELFKQQIISANDLQMAQNSLASAKAALAQCQAALVNAERNLEFCKVTSPIDGLVGIIPYSPGNLVSSTSTNPLTTITDVAKMRCYFSISEREALALSRQYGSPEEIAAALPEVELNLVDGSRYPYKGRVITVSGVPDGTTGSIRIRADFPNPEMMIKSGFSGTLLMPTTVEDAIVIPQQASYEIQSKRFVYVVSDSNTVHATPIEVLSLNDGTNFVVTSGLKAGQKIVTDGVTFLREGQTIAPRDNAKNAKAE